MSLVNSELVILPIQVTQKKKVQRELFVRKRIKFMGNLRNKLELQEMQETLRTYPKSSQVRNENNFLLFKIGFGK